MPSASWRQLKRQQGRTSLLLFWLPWKNVLGIWTPRSWRWGWGGGFWGWLQITDGEGIKTEEIPFVLAVFFLFDWTYLGVLLELRMPCFMVFLCWGISMMIFGQEISMAAWSAASTSEGKRVVQILGQVGGGKWPNVIPPWKLTCPPQRDHLKWNRFFQPTFFQGTC